VDTNFSEKYTASIFKVKDGKSRFLQDVVPIYPITQYHDTEENSVNLHHLENRKSHSELL
jgi:type IV secretory pathway VirB4 component